MLARSEEAHRALVQIVLTGGGLRPPVRGARRHLRRGRRMVTTPDGRVLASAGGLEQVEDLGCFDGSGRFIVEAEPVGPARRRTGFRPRRRPHRGRRARPRPARGVLPRPRDDRRRRAPAGAGRDGGRAGDHQGSRPSRRSRASTAADFLRDVLTGRAGTAERRRRARRALGWDVDRPVVVVVAELDPDQAPSAPPGTSCARRRSGSRPPGARACARATRAAPVGGLQPRGGGRARRRRRRRGRRPTGWSKELDRAVTGDRRRRPASFSTGVSRPLDGLGRRCPRPTSRPARRCAWAGSSTAPARSRTSTTSASTGCSSLVPDTAELRAFVAETARASWPRDDDPEAADLRRTLQVLLDTNLQRRRDGPAAALPLQHPALPDRQAGAAGRPVHHDAAPAARPRPGAAGPADARHLTTLHRMPTRGHACRQRASSALTPGLVHESVA